MTQGVDAAAIAARLFVSSSTQIVLCLTMLRHAHAAAAAGVAADAVQWSSYTVDHSQSIAGKLLINMSQFGNYTCDWGTLAAAAIASAATSTNLVVGAVHALLLQVAWPTQRKSASAAKPCRNMAQASGSCQLRSHQRQHTGCGSGLLQWASSGGRSLKALCQGATALQRHGLGGVNHQSMYC
jgi:hypothetical protein